MKNILIIIAISAVFAGCKKEQDQRLEKLALSQKILFQFEYTNSAWGKQHSGWFIDSAGYIRKFDKPAAWIHHDDEILSEEEMNQNLSSTTLSATTISKETLKEKNSLINKAVQGELKSPGAGGYDMGAICWYVFTYDNTEKTYKRHLLKQEGDWVIVNQSREAQALAKWLRELHPTVR